MIQLELFSEFEGAPASAHSKIGASSMSRWSKCPGSVRMCEGVENISSKYAEEGTRAHELAANILSRVPVVVEDPEMFRAVAVYLEYIWGASKKADLYVEHRFDLSTLHKGLFGTADAVIYREDSKHLIVADYKHGAGVAVEVESNPQLLYYGLGALLTLGIAAETVELVVVQPRRPHKLGPVRTWTIPSIDLLDFSADLISYARATESPAAALVPGSHCRFCPAKSSCSESHRAEAEAALESARSVFQPVDPSTV